MYKTYGQHINIPSNLGGIKTHLDMTFQHKVQQHKLTMLGYK